MRRLVSGWCQNGYCHKCPGLLRAHMVTPKGKELREIVCACRVCRHGEVG